MSIYLDKKFELTMDKYLAPSIKCGPFEAPESDIVLQHEKYLFVDKEWTRPQ